MCGDNLYKSFPNLYTIRGTWFRSLKKLVPFGGHHPRFAARISRTIHGQPIAGAATNPPDCD